MSERATSFGAEAWRYERARPGYPDELFERLLHARPRTALDIGCGTGKVGRALLERGCSVLGVEADGRMAAVARERGLQVEEARFEGWDPRGRRFELAVCGQAWHWLDAGPAVPKLASVLVPGGRAAVFWNIARSDDPLSRDLDEVYGRLHPDPPERLPPGEKAAEAVRAQDDLGRAGSFRAVESWIIPWRRTYTRDEWLDMLRTHSDHIVLDPGPRAELLDALAATIDAHGGVRAVEYETTVVTGVRA